MRAESKDRLIDELREKLYRLESEDRDLGKLEQELDAVNRDYELLQGQRSRGQRVARDKL